MTFISRLAAVVLAAMTTFWIVPASAQSAPPPRGGGAGAYQQDELVTAGHRFFGNVSRGLASVIERAVSQWGLPNGLSMTPEGKISGSITDTSTATTVSIPLANINLTGYFIYARVTDSQPTPAYKEAIFFIPTVPI